jgi:hypothetical protein
LRQAAEPVRLQRRHGQLGDGDVLLPLKWQLFADGDLGISQIDPLTPPRGRGRFESLRLFLDRCAGSRDGGDRIRVDSSCRSDRLHRFVDLRNGQRNQPQGDVSSAAWATNIRASSRIAMIKAKKGSGDQRKFDGRHAIGAADVVRRQAIAQIAVDSRQPAL